MEAVRVEDWQPIGDLRLDGAGTQTRMRKRR